MRGGTDGDVSGDDGGGKEMSNNMPLAESFSNSIKEESFSCLSEIAEAALDSITNDGFVTNVPLISTVVSLYKIGNSIRERAYLKKLAVFIDAFNRGVVDEEERQLHLQKFCEDKRSRERELEYIVLLLDRQLECTQAYLLAKFYLHYLNGKITWDNFCVYAGIIDKILIADIDCVKEIYKKELITSADIDESGEDSIMRISSLGIIRANLGLAYTPNVRFEYLVTERGKEFGKIAFE